MRKLNYEVGDIVPYKNTRSKVCDCKILSFEKVEGGNTWFNGVDIKTNASVFYPVYRSIQLQDTPMP